MKKLLDKTTAAVQNVGDKMVSWARSSALFVVGFLLFLFLFLFFSFFPFFFLW
jgi:hypothetical protein